MSSNGSGHPFIFSRSAFLAGLLLVGALQLVGWYVTVHYKTQNLLETDAFVAVVLFVGMAMGDYIGKALTKRGGKGNSFLIGTFTPMFATLMTGVVIGAVNWILGLAMPMLTLSIIMAHRSEVVQEHESLGSLIKWFSEYIPGFVLPILGFWFYIVPIILTALHL